MTIKQLIPRLVAIYLLLAGIGSPSVATSANQIDFAEHYRKAQVAFKSNDLDCCSRELVLCLSSLQAGESTGKNGELKADCLIDLAEVEARMGKLQAAEAALTEALALQEQMYWTEHPYVSQTRHRLRDLYIKQGKLQQAERLFKQDMELQERILGPEDPEYIRTVVDLANFYTTEKQFQLAEPLLVKALSVTEKNYTERRPELMQLRTLAGDFYNAAGKPLPAIVNLQKLVQVYSHDEPMVRQQPFAAERACLLLGHLYAGALKFDKAESTFKTGLHFAQISRMNTDSMTNYLREYLGDLYLNNERTALAAPLFNQAIEARKSAPIPAQTDMWKDNMAAITSDESKLKKCAKTERVRKG